MSAEQDFLAASGRRGAAVQARAPEPGAWRTFAPILVLALVAVCSYWIGYKTGRAAGRRDAQSPALTQAQVETHTRDFLAYEAELARRRAEEAAAALRRFDESGR